MYASGKRDNNKVSIDLLFKYSESNVIDYTIKIFNFMIYIP